MLKLDKEKFFTKRQLPSIEYHYLYNGENIEISLAYVIGSIDSSEERCLFLLNELNATDDFLINVYLQDIAYECVQTYIRNNFVDEISDSLLVKRKKYKFKINTNEYIAYQDDEGRYHLDKVDEVHESAGWASYNKFEERLFGLLNKHTFDCEKIEKPTVD